MTQNQFTYFLLIWMLFLKHTRKGLRKYNKKSYKSCTISRWLHMMTFYPWMINWRFCSSEPLKCPVFNQSRGSPTSYRRKHPTIWDKSINIQRKRFLEQLTSKFKIMSVITSSSTVSWIHLIQSAVTVST